ncbi:hypothetical protein [Microvirga brassicacearum]|uniref:Uncharacterized protein n=1 Tax=Microvirga brassicacearum TaxID=2580413 RepID=A0A5N3PH45_9HYPH|nr:hypothetical protein [Microvirga brassicacearum]KAB0269051.1 hypothetical protein FEZ63_02790 [Microvirga brassicacearum]
MSDLQPTRRRLTILSALATGWLPWGVEWKPYLSLCGNEYILCCGHVMGRSEAQVFVDQGLLEAGDPDRFGRPTLVITERGKGWLGSNWGS